MRVYMFSASLYCSPCGEQKRAELDAVGKRPLDVSNESSYDSDNYPKGPYPDGGGEADCPQHCDTCETFLENPLTSHGLDYVRECMLEYAILAEGDCYTIERWSGFYGGDIDSPTWKELIEAGYRMRAAQQKSSESEGR